jgi:hypothetical protein
MKVDDRGSRAGKSKLAEAAVNPTSESRPSRPVRPHSGDDSTALTDADDDGGICRSWRLGDSAFNSRLGYLGGSITSSVPPRILQHVRRYTTVLTEALVPLQHRRYAYLPGLNGPPQHTTPTFSLLASPSRFYPHKDRPHLKRCRTCSCSPQVLHALIICGTADRPEDLCSASKFLLRT